jgi:hypothetical protein
MTVGGNDLVQNMYRDPEEAMPEFARRYNALLDLIAECTAGAVVVAGNIYHPQAEFPVETGLDQALDRANRIIADAIAAHGFRLPSLNATLRSRLQWAHRTRKMKLLAKVDMELSKANLPEWLARRYRMHFEGLANMLSLIGLVRVVRYLRHIQFFESVDLLNTHLCKESLKKEADEQYLGMWRSRSGTLLLANGEKHEPLIGSEQAIYAHEIVHVLASGSATATPHERVERYELPPECQPPLPVTQLLQQPLVVWQSCPSQQSPPLLNAPSRPETDC